MPKEFHRLISLDEARSMALSATPQAREELLPLDEALGRVLARSVASSVDVPGFDRAAMDGYAVRWQDTMGAREDRTIELRLGGLVAMGQSAEASVEDGTAVIVSTGSMMPAGANAVMMVEYAEQDGDLVRMTRPVAMGENVHRAGSDIGYGETVLSAGTRLTPREIGVLSAIGMKEVPVRALQVGIASSGDELVPPGKALGPGQVYDINTHTLAAAVRGCGAEAAIYGILPDKLEEMAKILDQMARECDLAIVSGSTSAGAGDMLYTVVESLGEIIFHGINLKPGKPTILGTLLAKPVFGLPGYPTSALTVFSQVVEPAIRLRLGLLEEGRRIEGRLARPVRSEGRHQMLAVGISRGLVYPVDKGSGSITTLASADGVIELAPEIEYMDRGDLVVVHAFGEYREPHLVVAGESCPGLDAILRHLPYPARMISNGTRLGIMALKDGVADIACIMGDQKPGPFTIPGYSREIGMISKDESLLDPSNLEGVRVAGWARESGMAELLEKALGNSGAILVGRARSHSAVCAAVASGRVEAGFAARAAAVERGLSFRALMRDRISFAVSPTRADSRGVASFKEALEEVPLPPGMERDSD
ncbi:MAG: molybdopterin biosynthesis protein [Methanotrichaceae archaeon]|nr:molybdopterin biosynthesis protein [Methanotrichaceae archaeon]